MSLTSFPLSILEDDGIEGAAAVRTAAELCASFPSLLPRVRHLLQQLASRALEETRAAPLRAALVLLQQLAQQTEGRPGALTAASWIAVCI